MAGHGDKLSRHAFIQALHDIKMDCTEEEAAEIFAAFDTEGNGFIDMKEFLFQLRLLSLVSNHCRVDRCNFIGQFISILYIKAREALVSRCFKKSDKNNDDVITVDDLRLIIFWLFFMCFLILNNIFLDVRTRSNIIRCM